MPVRNLLLIRIALMTGVFMFAGIAYFGPRAGMTPVVTFPGNAETFRYLLWGFIAVAAAGALLLRTRVEGSPPAKQATFLIIGWALGEAAALFGVVSYLAGNGVQALGLGLMTFVFTLVLLPIPRVRR